MSEKMKVTPFLIRDTQLPSQLGIAANIPFEEAQNNDELRNNWFHPVCSGLTQSIICSTSAIPLIIMTFYTHLTPKIRPLPALVSRGLPADMMQKSIGHLKSIIMALSMEQRRACMTSTRSILPPGGKFSNMTPKQES